MTQIILSLMAQLTALMDRAEKVCPEWQRYAALTGLPVYVSSVRWEMFDVEAHLMRAYDKANERINTLRPVGDDRLAYEVAADAAQMSLDAMRIMQAEADGMVYSPALALRTLEGFARCNESVRKMVNYLRRIAAEKEAA